MIRVKLATIMRLESERGWRWNHRKSGLYLVSPRGIDWRFMHRKGATWLGIEKKEGK